MAQDTETLQEVAETAIHHLSRIANILASAARDVVTELGEMVSDVAEVAATKRPQQVEPPIEE
ncbi:hypothetical protein ACFQ1S_06575 [Kibdelosporangium lantanae]|uniref:Uncharacterized protein n=1 Tax=Kibdelosporangium lantanae TaxID=1497396 RepID=A0ABW3M3K4_9PSEU